MWLITIRRGDGKEEMACKTGEAMGQIEEQRLRAAGAVVVYSGPEENHKPEGGYEPHREAEEGGLGTGRPNGRDVGGKG